MEFPCPQCDMVFKSVEDLTHHSLTHARKKTRTTQSQFKQVEKNYWVMRYKGYRVEAHKVDDHIEMTIQAIPTSDPNAEDWQNKIVPTADGFFRRLLHGEDREKG